MSKLEDDLGVLLFYRDNKGIELTPSGEILYKYLKDIKDLLYNDKYIDNDVNNECIYKVYDNKIPNIIYQMK